jgi:site-specific DNA-cytosine methylase
MPAGFELVATVDQDADARATHELNHRLPVLPQDLATIDARELARWDAACWLLSPPCQPFTRRGRGRDVDDPRCRGLLRMIELLPVLRPRRVLVENVVGFHGSRAHELLITALRALAHDVADVQACPSDEGWPVRRPRQFVVSSADGLAPMGPADPGSSPSLAQVLDDDPPGDDLLLPDAWRARVEPVQAPAIPLPTFTRSYGHAIDAAGAILPSSRGPRFLSPDEILRLHGFPPGFAWPPRLNLRTRWRLAGNSVHVASVRRIAARLA